MTDITYIGLASGFAYLAAILDVCSRRIVGYAVSRYIDTELALAALDAAVQNRRPEPGRCIQHSDRGCQYASGLSGGAEPIRSGRLDERSWKSTLQCTGREFHENTEGRRNLSRRV